MLPAVVAGEIRETLLDYLRTTWSLSDRESERALFEFLLGEQGIFKGPYLRMRLPFEPAAPGAVVPLDIGVPYTPHRHQLEAWKRLSTRDGHEPEPTLVVTGTGSGKTEAFLMPILDHCLRAKRRGEKGIKAIVLYPMNALAADQARRVAEIIWESGDGEHGMNGRVRAGMYVGGKGSHAMMGPDHVIDVDNVLRQDPPDLLLTNYKMLDFLLLRPKDRELWKHNGPSTLQYVVLDELHTYDGAQGTDVACLIRRLDARLGGKRTFCAVGTSATVTGESGRVEDQGSPSASADRPGGVRAEGAGGPRIQNSDARLLEFASAIFDRAIGADAVIGEQRRTPASFFDLFARPSPGELPGETEVLEAREDDDLDSFVGRVARAWFPKATRLGAEGKAVSRTVLGEMVIGHPTVRALIEVASERLATLEELDALLVQADAKYAARSDVDRRRLLGSMLAMVSWAEHEQASGRTAPLLNVQVQLWVREIRRLVRALDGEQRFAWRDEEPDVRGATLMLPPYHCRSCGHGGWMTVGSDHGDRLERDLGRIYRAMLQRDPDMVYLHQDPLAAPEGVLPEMREHVCVRCARIGREAACRHCQGATVAVWKHEARSQQVPPKDTQRCPACQTDFALSVLASRAATLSSVAVGHLYSTPFNSDKKLLAFSDSVQDASHRAGFYAGRTYRFTLRSAMLAVIPKEEDVALPDVAGRMRERLEEKLSPAGATAALMPRDLDYLPAYQKYMEQAEQRKAAGQDAGAVPEGLREDLDKRLGWEVTRELGLAARIGRTLERTGCVGVAVDADVMRRAVGDLGERMRARYGALLDVPDERFRVLIAGLVHRVRHRGGVWDPLLDRYFQRKGHGAYLTKRTEPLLSPFGPRTSRPIFLTEEADAERFDTLKPSRDNWYVDWARRVLGAATISVADARDLYRDLIAELVKAGLFRASERAPRAYGIAPSALRVSRATQRLECGECGLEHVDVPGEPASLEGATCLRYRCRGTLAVAAAADPEEERTRSYYRRFYERAELGRVWASEHTGMLPRGDREKIEALFKERHRPDAPNMLSCTPTLEMGIDIGDLSSTMLISVPPTPASYLQRVGRAGRRTGNALVLTFTTVAPHDLYFFDDPEAAMAGPVQPPGCYLDAPEILKRHALAWCLDAWARDGDGRATLPMQVRPLLRDPSPETFPAPFFEFVAANRDALRSGFERAFAVSEGTKRELGAFFEGKGPLGSALEQRLHGTIAEMRGENALLRRLFRNVRDKLNALDAAPQKSDDYEEERRELLAEKGFLDKELSELNGGYLLQVLCERGLLPNYAFPEEGVKLRAFVAREDAGSPERFEWVRAGQTAIRELAPFNTFYGMARKVRVDNVDVREKKGGGKAGLIEDWQLCSQCGYMQPVGLLGTARVCPRCSAEDWREKGRQRKLIQLRNVFAYARQRDAAFSDENEERERGAYVTETWLDPDPAVAREAWLNQDAKFGFEHLPKLMLREINFGRDKWGTTFQAIGGRQVPDVAFELCAECGQVREEDPERRRRRTRPLHRPWCNARNKPEEKQPFTGTHLYRELRSEALRLVLPISMLDPEVQLPNARAVLELGMRRHFGGDPDHLRVMLHDEPTFLSEGGRRRYLVVHDTVAGGTGVLAELAAHRGAKLRAVLEAAREGIVSCPCKSRVPAVRGCYRCLYAHRRQADLAVLDREVALKLVDRWLAAFEGLRPTTTVSVLEMASILESELEHRFISRLGDWAEGQPDVTMTETSPERWRLEVAGKRWQLVPQVTLDQGDDVAIPCRPDFVLYPEGHEALPVALFADGASYHVQPAAARGRIADDFAKREAILASGRFVVWSFAWQDVDELFGGGGGELAPWIEREDVRANARDVARQVGGDGLAEMVRTAVARDPIRGLIAYLREPDIVKWRMAAAVCALAIVRAHGKGATAASVDGFARRLAEEVDPGPPLVAAGGDDVIWAPLAVGGPLARLLLWGSRDDLAKAARDASRIRAVLRFDDRASERSAPAFVLAWRTWLRAHALLQFLPSLRTVTTEQLLPSIDAVDEIERQRLPRVDRAAEALRTQMSTSKAEDEIDYIEDDAVKALVRAAVAAGAPVPDIPYEHGDDEVGVRGEIEVGWPRERVGIFMERDDEPETAEELRRSGWTVFAATDLPSLDALREALGLVE